MSDDEKGMTQAVTAVIVHHNTPDLLSMAVWSLHSLYPELPLLLVESGSDRASLDTVAQLDAQLASMRVLDAKANVHHGPGLDLGIRAAQTDWVLIFDSDCIAFRAGFVEAMFEGSDDAYLIGDHCTVDDDGFNVKEGVEGFEYVHPRCALVRRTEYLKLPPFEKHGAPCLANQVAAAKIGLGTRQFNVDQWVYHRGRGTVDKHGYQLGIPDMIRKGKTILKKR